MKYHRAIHKCERDTAKIIWPIFSENQSDRMRKEKYFGKSVAIPFATMIFLFFFILLSHSPKKLAKSIAEKCRYWSSC